MRPRRNQLLRFVTLSESKSLLTEEARGLHTQPTLTILVASGSHAKCCNHGGCSHAIDWPAENTLLVEYLRHAAHAWKSAQTDQ